MKTVVDDFNESVNIITNKFNLNPEQIIVLQKLPIKWLTKFKKAITVSDVKGYSLDYKITGLNTNDPLPRIDFIHTYDINRLTKKYKHTISIKIKI